MRKRAIALVFFGSTVWAQLAHGLGLGDIEVYSALNQVLEAEISLTSVRPDELDGLIVKLASEEAFAQAGVERPFYLTRLKFSLASKPDGTPYVKVSTEDPVREPFLNFLIDIDWPRGRLVREYTVLLDPPVFASPQQSTAPQITSTTDDSLETGIAAGEPALIEREPVEEGFDFGAEEGLETAGLDEPMDAGSLLAGIPDIEVEDVPAEESTGETAAVEPVVDSYEMDGETGWLAEADDETPATRQEVFEFEDEGLEVQDTVETSEDAQGVAEAITEETLPDIDIVLDETLPYDEVATNALLAQFAAEDAVRGAPGWSGDTGPDAGQDQGDVSGGDEHEVQAGDTLHEIASRYKPADISVNQAMLAILRYNPNAFIRGNINDVKKGFVLRIPVKSAMLEMSDVEALEEVKRQTALWREYKSQLVGAASATQDAQSADTFQSSRTDFDDGAETGGELTILSPGRNAEAGERAAGQQEGVEAGSGALYRDLQLAREQLAAERLEKIELQERLTELDDQLETMERLITLKNGQLAQLQQQLSELKAGTGSVTESGEELPVAPEEAQDAGELPSPATGIDATGDSAGLEETKSDFGLTLEGHDESSETELDLMGETDAAEPETTEAKTTAQPAPEDTVSSPENKASTAGDDESQNVPASDIDDTNTVEQADSSADQGQTTGAEVPVSSLPPPKRTGISGWVYENLPSPYNLMLADALESRVGMAILGAIAIALLLIVLSAAKSKGKSKTAAQKLKQTESTESEVAAQTVRTKAIKPPLGERLKAMFAPLGGLFTSNKKSSLISMMTAGAAAGKSNEPDEEKVIDDGDDDEEAESFDETVMVAAAAVKSDASKKAASPEAAKTPTADSSVLKTEIVEPEEEVADDTTAEADVYLAYGLFDQAEELLTQALAANPDKLEYKGKLLETYFAAGKKADFEKLAAGVHSSLKGRPSRIWDKALVMGKEIAPENNLFSGATNPELKISDFAPAKPETADLDLSGSQGKTTPDIEFGDEEGDSTTADFDLDFGEDDGKFEETYINPGSSNSDDTGGELAFELNSDDAADELSVDFNADELGLGTDFSATAGQPESDEDDEDSANDATVAIDMGFDLPDEAGDVDVDMDLSDLDISGIEDDIESESSAGDELIAELDSNDSQEVSVNTEFEILDDDTIIDSELDDDTFGGDSSLDEVATKLDLAKAYMDMGDYDGASSTLEEVLAEGNDSQRQEAEELLDQIN